ncbi:MAG: hypothetical protein ACXV5N_08705 [Halobacteriota archaeon]
MIKVIPSSIVAMFEVGCIAALLDANRPMVSLKCISTQEGYGRR